MSKNDDNVKIANILDACLVVLILFFLSLCLKKNDNYKAITNIRTRKEMMNLIIPTP